MCQQRYERGGYIRRKAEFSGCCHLASHFFFLLFLSFCHPLPIRSSHHFDGKLLPGTSYVQIGVPSSLAISQPHWRGSAPRLNSHRQTRLLGNPPSYLQQSVLFTKLWRNTLLTSCLSAPAFCASPSLSFSLAISTTSPHTEHVHLCSVPRDP